MDVITKTNNLISVCKYGKIMDLIKLLKDPRVDPTENNSEALYVAFKKYHVDIIIILLQDGRSDPTFDDNRAVQICCLNNNTEILKILLKDPRVDPCDHDNSAISIAIKQNHFECIKLICNSNRYQIDDRMILLALADKNLVIAEYLINYGNTRTGKSLNNTYNYIKNKSVVMYIYKNEIEILELLLTDLSIDIMFNKCTVIEAVMINNRIDIMRMLMLNPRIKYKKYINEIFRIAIKHKRIEILQLLATDKRVNNAIITNALNFAIKYEYKGVILFLKSYKNVNF